MSWRDRLAAMRARHADVVSVESADSSCERAIGTNGTIDIGVEAENDCGGRGAALPSAPTPALGAWGQWALAFIAEAAEALAGREPDDIEAVERHAVAAEGAGGLGEPPEGVVFDWEAVDARIRGATA